MMQLEDRLTQHFQHEAAAHEGAGLPSGDLGAVKARARQRTRNRGITTALAGLALAAVGIVGAMRIVEQNQALRIETLDDNSGEDQGSFVPGLPASDGPVLQWRDLGTDAFESRSAVWTGEYFVVFGYRTPNTGLGEPSIGGLYRSPDGESWELATEPAGNEEFHNVALWSDGDGTVLAWSNTYSNEAVTRVLRSDDHGRTYADLGSFPISNDDNGPIRDIAQAFGVVSVGDDVYASVAHTADLDLALLLEAAGRDDLAGRVRSGEIGLGYGLGLDGLSVCLDDNCEQVEVIGLDDMELSDTVRARLEDEQRGGRVEAVRLVPGEAPVVLGSWAGRFVSDLLVDGRLAIALGVSDVVDGEIQGYTRLVTSDDGQTWTEADLTIDAFGVWLDGDGALVASSSGGDELRLDRSTDGGTTWSALAPAPGQRFIEGPAGVLVEGYTGTETTSWPGYAVAKDHYRLEVTEESAVLIDTDSGARLAEAGTSDDVSWLIEREATDEQDQWTLTVLHPDTGEELMVITERDLADLGALDNRSEPLRTLGWSADGTTWGWQTYGQAFGPDVEDDQRRGNESIQLVVGSDRVLALVPPPSVSGLDPTEDSSVADSPAADPGEDGDPVVDREAGRRLSRLFVADVPSR